MKTKEINTSNSRVSNLKNDYTKELNTVNHYYWPIMAKLNKQYANLKWYLTLAFCLEVTFIVCIIFFEIYGIYWVIGYNVIGLGLILLVYKFFRKCKKAKLASQKEWDEALKNSEKIKENLDKEIDNAKRLMIDFLKEEENLSEEKLLEKTGSSYEDVLSYYNHWIDNN